MLAVFRRALRRLPLSLQYDPDKLASPPYELSIRSEAPFLGDKVGWGNAPQSKSVEAACVRCLQPTLHVVAGSPYAIPACRATLCRGRSSSRWVPTAAATCWSRRSSECRAGLWPSFVSHQPPDSLVTVREEEHASLCSVL